MIYDLLPYCGTSAVVVCLVIIQDTASSFNAHVHYKRKGSGLNWVIHPDISAFLDVLTLHYIYTPV